MKKILYFYLVPLIFCLGLVSIHFLTLKSELEKQSLSSKQDKTTIIIPSPTPTIIPAPISIYIPKIKVKTQVVRIGTLPDSNEMAVPANAKNVGWYEDLHLERLAQLCSAPIMILLPAKQEYFIN